MIFDQAMGYEDENESSQYLTNNTFQNDQQPTSSGSPVLQSDSTPDSSSMIRSNYNDYEADGRRVSIKEDSSGQGKICIPPGDPAKEIYRMRTYMEFPDSVPVDPCVLARHGFLYTGHKDKVKCFSCKAAIQDWCARDDPKLARWHYEGCKLVLGLEALNKPLDKNQPIEFVGTFTSCLPTGDSGYSSPSSSFSSSPPSSSPCGSPSSSHQETPMQLCHGRPNSSTGHLALVAADDGIGSLHSDTTPSTEDLLGITRGLKKVRIDRSGLALHENHTQSSPPSRQTASNEKHPGSWPSKNVKGLVIARVTSSTHLRFLNEDLDLHNEADRIKSFAGWRNHNVTIQSLAKSGFFYLGDQDRVQCFSCSFTLRNWRCGDDADVEHRRISPNCKLMLNLEARNIPLPGPVSNSHPDPSYGEKKMLEKQFPCIHPVNPHMRDFVTRLQTFDGRWPSHKVLASKDCIARAGFFFLGNNDRAKCWYCNGGLQNWDPNDDPFAEHAKWFPGCEYILQFKGVDFVKRIVSNFPNLRRPTLKNSRFDHYRGMLITPPSELSSTQTSIVDPRSGMNAGDLLMSYSPSTSSSQDHLPSQTRDAPRSTSFLENTVKTMGFSKEEIQRAIERQREVRGRDFQTTEELVDVILSLPPSSTSEALSDARGGKKLVVGNASSTALKRSNSVEDREESSEEETSGESATKILKLSCENPLTKELEELENERKCKSCFQHQADTVIIPCGHLSICKSCSTTAKKCAVCHTKIQSLIKVYLA